MSLRKSSRHLQYEPGTSNLLVIFSEGGIIRIHDLAASMYISLDVFEKKFGAAGGVPPSSICIYRPSQEGTGAGRLLPGDPLLVDQCVFTILRADAKIALL